MFGNKENKNNVIKKLIRSWDWKKMEEKDSIYKSIPRRTCSRELSDRTDYSVW